MEIRRKLRSVELNDFRAFKGKKCFDFTLEGGEAADLIAIYAPNGMGKTSFFDAVEWGFTGAIDRLENDIKAKNFEGYILKNRDSLEEVTSVSIDFDDNMLINRRTQRINKKDYTKGKLTDSHGICEYKDWGSLILPHNKIDGLISATSPTDKYNYWGSYWDSSKSERKIFNFLYNIKKQTEIKIKNIDDLIVDTVKEHDQLALSSEKLNVINQYIEQYNKLSNSNARLVELGKDSPLEFYEKFTNNLSAIQQNLKEKNDKYQSNLNQLNSLKTDYAEFERYLRRKEEIDRLRKRWLIILNKCKIKSQKIKELNKLLDDMKKNQQVIAQLNRIYGNGEVWVKEYLNSIKASNMMGKVAENRNEILESLNSWIKQKNYIESEINAKDQNIKSLNDIKIRLFELINKIEKQNIRLDSKRQRKVRVNNIEQKINNYFSKLQFESKMINDLYISKEDNIIQKITLSNIEIDSASKNQFLLAFIEAIRNIKELEKDVVNTRKRYEESEKLTTELNNIIRNGRDYIYNNNLEECPLCKAKYSNVEELIARTMLDMRNSVSTQTHYNAWFLCNDELKKANEKLMDLINRWNSFLNKIKEANETQSLKCTTKKDRLIVLKNKIAEQISNIDSDITTLCSDSKKLGFDEAIFTKEHVNIWFEKKNEFYINTITPLKKQLNDYEEYIKKANENNAILENEYKDAKLIKESFETDSNRALTSFLKDLMLPCDWGIICEKKLLLENKERNDFINVEKLKKLLKDYSGINIEKENYYMEKYSEYDSEFRSLTDEMQKYIIRYTSFFGNKNVNPGLLLKRHEKTAKYFNITKQRINELNGITSQVAFSDYFKRIEAIRAEIYKARNEKAKISLALLRLNSLFEVAKSKLEEKVTGIFNEVLTNDIFQRIEPHPFMKRLKYEVSFNESDKPELNIYVVNDNEDDKYLPEWYFSSAQLNVVALSTFLGRALSLQQAPVHTIFIDDPIGHFDDINMIAFVDLLRSFIEFKCSQIIISTHDESMFNLLKRKIPTKYYKSKFVVFKSIGEFT